jgi:hypothetical protein
MADDDNGLRLRQVTDIAANHGEIDLTRDLHRGLDRAGVVRTLYGILPPSLTTSLARHVSIAGKFFMQSRAR